MGYVHPTLRHAWLQSKCLYPAFIHAFCIRILIALVWQNSTYRLTISYVPAHRKNRCAAVSHTMVYLLCSVDIRRGFSTVYRTHSYELDNLCSWSGHKLIMKALHTYVEDDFLHCCCSMLRLGSSHNWLARDALAGVEKFCITNRTLKFCLKISLLCCQLKIEIYTSQVS